MRNIFSKAIWWLLPLTIILLIISFHQLQHLSNEKALPDEGWSRSVSFPAESTFKPKYFIREHSEGFTIYSTAAKGLTELKLDHSLDVLDHSHVSVSIPGSSEFWVNDSGIIYVKNNQLIVNEAGEEVLAENVDGLKVEGDRVLFWSGNKIYGLDPIALSTELIGEAPGEIKAVESAQNSASILVKSTEDNVNFSLVYLQKKEDQTYQSIPLVSFIQSEREIIKEVSFAENNGSIHLFYRVEDSAGGKLTNRVYYASVDLNKYGDGIQPKQVQFADGSGIPIQNPTDLKVMTKDNQIHILFSGKSYTDEYGTNIYEAKQVEGNWVAEKRSKTRGVSEKPIWVQGDSIIWSEFSKGAYTLTGASTHESTIVKSRQLNSQDWLYSVSNTVDSIFKSLLLAFILLLFIVPVYIVQFIIWKLGKYRYHNEKFQKIMIIVIRVLFISIQIYVLNHVLKVDAFYADLFSMKISLLAAAVFFACFAWLLEALIGRDTWEMTQKISYFMIVQIFMLSFLIGSAIF